MKAANLPIKLQHWNSAIILTGRHFPSTDEVESALSMWKDMENIFGVQGDHITFSILFDLAVKSEQYVLAEMVEKEATKRKLKVDRVSQMGRIFLNGVRGDGIGVRRAYSDLVEAGEIVDTAVLTNVITSLINAGEVPAAEMTFARMKRLHAEKQGATMPPDNWREDKALQKILRDAANRYRNDSEARLTFQEASPIAPHWKTYRAFIRYHALESGNYDRVLELLDEMQMNGIRMTGTIYYWTFRGFLNHGGFRYSSWRTARLEELWLSFLEVSKNNPIDIFIDHGLVVQVVKAFAKCAGTQRASEIWTDIRGKWDPPDKTLLSVKRVLENKQESPVDVKRRWGFL